jgi:hypothetical protein
MSLDKILFKNFFLLNRSTRKFYPDLRKKISDPAQKLNGARLKTGSKIVFNKRSLVCQYLSLTFLTLFFYFSLSHFKFFLKITKTEKLKMLI